MPVPRLTSVRRLARRALTACGAAGLLGSAASAGAAVPPQRAALEARVAQVRSELAATPEAARTPFVVAANNWNNWPNWSNWAKWANG